MAGLVFIVVGVVFLLERLGVVSVSPSFVLPVILVAIGVGLLVGRRAQPPRADAVSTDVHAVAAERRPDVPDDVSPEPDDGTPEPDDGTPEPTRPVEERTDDE